MRWVVLLFALGAVASTLAVPPTAENCVSWDDRIENVLFQPLREKFHQYSSEFKNFSSADLGWFKFGVNWQGGTSGNFSTFRLNKIPGKSPASSLCEVSTQRILFANFTYDDLRAEFKNVELYTPFFTLGDYQPTLVFKGINMFAYINATTDATTKQCKASLGWFLLEGFDSLHLEMSGSLFGWFATKIFNLIASPRIAAFLTAYSENQSISYQVMQFLAPAVQADNAFFCKALQ